LLEKAGLLTPQQYLRPEDIDALAIVKLPHAVKRLERGFFTVASYREYVEKTEALLRRRTITPQDLAEARMEKYIIGPVFNLDFFYSPLAPSGEGLELLGVDWRFESSLDGHVRLPAPQQLTLPEEEGFPEYTVCGHNAATLRESLLEQAFQLGEGYVKATRDFSPPGIIGPFSLQTCIDKDLKFFIYDVSPRIGGGTNAHMAVGHPYGNSLWRRPMSTGHRLALEVRRALEMGELGKIVT
jgi:5-formaminoimidazole-4-carboxamide-1-(beta)-D-ribofuranosyl 5'-monophosphate synthetase